MLVSPVSAGAAKGCRAPRDAQCAAMCSSKGRSVACSMLAVRARIRTRQAHVSSALHHHAIPQQGQPSQPPAQLPQHV
jgi:hypothetical protein